MLKKTTRSKKVYPLIKITIPGSIDYERIFKKIPEVYKVHKKKDITKRMTEKVKESVYLFISYLYISKNYDRKYSKKGYWKPILMKDFRYVTSVLEGVVLQLLENKDYPIIDVNKHCIKGVKPRSYRLRLEFYYKGLVPKEIEICSLVSEKYLEKITVTPIDFTKKNKSNFNYLSKSYNPSIISIDPKIHNFITKYKELLIERLSNLRSDKKREFFKIKIEEKINKFKNHLKNITEGNYNFKMSMNTRRCYSELNYCNKEIRSYYKLNNNKVVEIDIKNSHLYILSCILNNDFIKNTTDIFSLSKIDNKTYKKLNKSDNIINFNKNNPFINLKLFNNIFDLKEDNKTISDKLPSLLLYMMRLFAYPDVNEYKSLPFGEGIYDSINEDLFDGEKDKKYIKRNIMFFLNMIKYRNNNEVVEKMSVQFPAINEIVKIFNGRSIDDKNISILLQRVESYLLLEIGIKKVLEVIPNIDFITVHDSVVVEEKYAVQVKDILEKSISGVTGIPIGLDFKAEGDPMNNVEDIVEKSWMGIVNSYRKEGAKRRNRLNKIKKII